jgi:hypothetical protein
MPILWDLVTRRRERKDRKRAAKRGIEVVEGRAGEV